MNKNCKLFKRNRAREPPQECLNGELSTIFYHERIIMKNGTKSIFKRAVALIAALAVCVTNGSSYVSAASAGTEIPTDSKPVYQVLLEETKNGTIKVDREDGLYEENETVYIDAVGNEGYLTGEIIIKTDTDREVEVVITGEDTHFIMPGEDVTIEAVFSKTPSAAKAKSVAEDEVGDESAAETEIVEEAISESVNDTAAETETATVSETESETEVIGEAVTISEAQEETEMETQTEMKEMSALTFSVSGDAYAQVAYGGDSFKEGDCQLVTDAEPFVLELDKVKAHKVWIYAQATGNESFTDIMVPEGVKSNILRTLDGVGGFVYWELDLSDMKESTGVVVSFNSRPREARAAGFNLTKTVKMTNVNIPYLGPTGKYLKYIPYDYPTTGYEGKWGSGTWTVARPSLTELYSMFGVTKPDNVKFTNTGVDGSGNIYMACTGITDMSSGNDSHSGLSSNDIYIRCFEIEEIDDVTTYTFMVWAANGGRGQTTEGYFQIKVTDESPDPHYVRFKKKISETSTTGETKDIVGSKHDYEPAGSKFRVYKLKAAGADKVADKLKTSSQTRDQWWDTINSKAEYKNIMGCIETLFDKDNAKPGGASLNPNADYFKFVTNLYPDSKGETEEISVDSDVQDWYVVFEVRSPDGTNMGWDGQKGVPADKHYFYKVFSIRGDNVSSLSAAGSYVEDDSEVYITNQPVQTSAVLKKVFPRDIDYNEFGHKWSDFGFLVATKPDFSDAVEVKLTGEDTKINNLWVGQNYYIKENPAAKAVKDELGFEVNETVYSFYVMENGKPVYSDTHPQNINSDKAVDAYAHEYFGSEKKGIENPPNEGKGKVKKVSANPSISDGNSCYSYEGAEFKLTNKLTGKEVAERLVTKANGESQVITLPVGDYVLEETKAPRGSVLDTTKYTITIKKNQTETVTIKNDPRNDPARILLKKIDADTGKAVAVGDGEFKDAQYTFKYYDGYYKTEAELKGKTPLRTWVFATDDKGQIDLSLAPLISGDELYMSEGIRTLPLGTISVQETKAPVGYLLDTKVHIVNIEAELYTGNLIKSYQAPESPEPVERGGSSIQKFDIEYDAADEQGDATRKDATFELINRSEKSIRYDVDDKDYEPGEVIDTFKTDKDGIAKTVARALPYGTYEWREKEAPVGYLNTGVVSRTFTIREDNQYEELKASDTAIKNNIKRGSSSVEKWDNEIDKKQAQGGATLDNAVFELYNRSIHPVLIQEADKTLREVEVNGLIGTFITVDGVAATIPNYLPYGTYEWVEKASPLGYLHTGILSSKFEIREDGENVHLGTSATAIKNDPIRYDIKGVKIGERSNDRLSYVPFEIISDTTGETHIIVTDANGMFSTESSWNPHGQDTNRGKSEYDGIWFGNIETLDESKGALLYDTYTLRELPCESNKGYELLEFKIYPSLRHGTTIDLGTLDDPLPEPITIKTTAKDAETDLQYGYPGEQTTIIDTVSYKNVIVGNTYKVTGTLMLKATGQQLMADGKVVTASTEFTAKETEGTVDIAFTFDSSMLKGQSVVVFETMNLDNEQVAEHADITDGGQTVEYKDPELGTKASDVESGGNNTHVSKTTVIKDIVSYSDLIPGKKYTIKGTLMDKATGKPLVLSNGKTVTSETTFTAKKADGTAEVVFELDSSELAGAMVVVFESLQYNGREVAVHADITDKDQSIQFEEPKLGTTAADKTTGDHFAYASEETVIVDVVAYENLIPGKTYVLKGTVMDKKNGKVLKIDGKEVAAEKEFIPKKASGTVEMEFVFNSSKLLGKSVVVFEDLYYEGRLVGTHSDIGDEGQTVSFEEPQIGTKAADIETGTNEGFVSEETTIVDTVSYKNLIVGQTYVVKGQLIDKSTGDVLMSDGKKVTAETTFVPKTKDGTVEITFTFNSLALAGKAVVAFEYLYFNEKEIASHADIKDKDQTVEFKEPGVKTTAAEAKTGDKEIAVDGEVTIADIVKYENLIPGKEYTVKGILMDKATGEPLKINGKEVISEKTFKAKKASGTVSITFTFDASNLKDKEVVVFERLYFGEREIAAHADLDDKAQTVTFIEKQSTTTPGGGGGKTTTAVKTGDETNIVRYALMAGAAALALLIMVYKRKKQNA